MTDPSTLISPEQARRAFYVDFEGVPDHPPVLIGWAYAEGKKADEHRLTLRHDIFDPALRLAVDSQTIEGYWRHDQEGRSLGQSINDLARRARKQDRLIVSWSRHELDAVVAAELSPGLRRMFERVYRDGKATAKRWRREIHPGVNLPSGWGGKHKLVRYLELIGFELPADYGLGETADRIRSVRAALAAEGDYENLTPEMQAEWSGLLVHSAVDCVGLRSVVIRAADELAAL